MGLHMCLQYFQFCPRLAVERALQPLQRRHTSCSALGFASFASSVPSPELVHKPSVAIACLDQDYRSPHGPIYPCRLISSASVLEPDELHELHFIWHVSSIERVASISHFNLMENGCLCSIGSFQKISEKNWGPGDTASDN